MVNRGRSGACVTCKKRRIKCDEEKPNCQRCRRLGLECGGYGTQFRFKEQSHKFGPRVRIKSVNVKGVQTKCEEGSPTRNSLDMMPVIHRPEENLVMKIPRTSSVTDLPASPSMPDSAVAFYLRHYAGYGRSIESGPARGFFEVLIPIYCSQARDSPLAYSIEALSSLVLSLWRHGRKGAINCQNSQDIHARAVARLRKAIVDREQLKNPATLLAVLALQLYENVVAVYNFRPPAHIHHDGALSLLSIAEEGRKISTVAAYVRRFAVHIEVSSAMRQNRSTQTPARLFLPNETLLIAPYNPSMALDHIGAAIAQLQADCLKTRRQRLSLEADTLEAMAKSVDDRLLVWAERVPGHWHPIRLEKGSFDSSIPSYSNSCDTYSSCQIANIWNLWRSQRLLLVKLMLGLLVPGSPSNSSSTAEDDSPWSCETLMFYGDIVQDLIDGICRSVPFYLGNRVSPSAMADFTDPDIVLPDCPPIIPKEGSDHANYDRYQDLGKPPEEHIRHVIAQGPWHIQSPLSRLLTMFSEEPVFAEQLRPGQYQWIQSQFLRVLKLLHIVPLDFASENNVTADFLAEQVRQGAMFMSGP